MAEDNVVGLVKKKSECLNDFKMHETKVNGLVHEKDETISRILEKNGPNGSVLSNACELLPKKLNGFYNHIKTSASPAEGISAPSLRSSPIRNKSVSVNNSDGIKTEFKGENRLEKEIVKKESGVPCKWMDCHFVASNVSELASHAQEFHISPMNNCDVFVCLWQDCKVFNRPSCSLTWLTKHVESHIGVKPFKCVIDGCPLSFSSQTGLARHVPCHFEDNNKPKRNTNGGKEESPSKKHLKRKRLKYIRYKKANSLGKTEDFVDQHAIDSIKTRLTDMIVTDSNHLGIDGPSIHLKSQAWGRRSNRNGKTEILLHWIPESILPDEWISSSEVKNHLRRSVSIHSLPNNVKANLHPSFYRRLSHRKERRK